MRRKFFFFSFVAAVALLLGSVGASAQTGQLYGEVVAQKSDGTTMPVAGAAIDVYRTDISGKYNTKTDSKGKFVFAGLPFVGVYVIAVSAPGFQPLARGSIKAGRDVNYKFTLSPGDGRRMTEVEAKAAAAGGGGGRDSSGASSAPQVSEDDKKKIEEMRRKNAEIEAGNKKIEESNATVNRTFKAGNDALNLASEAMKAKNYDEALKQYSAAIAQYDEGINADPTHPGVASLLTNKSAALRGRGVIEYNAAIQSKDDAAKTSALETAKKDFKDSADAATKAVQMLNTQTPPTDPAAAQGFTRNKYFALSARAESMRLVVTKADPAQADAGITAYQEYMAAETDAAKKAQAQTEMAQMLLDAGQADKAYAEFQKALTDNPDNVDAILGAGLSLFASGDKSKFQEAANLLQRFVDKAPDTHKFKADAKSTLEFLKTNENVKPQKTTTPAGGRRRGQ